MAWPCIFMLTLLEFFTWILPSQADYSKKTTFIQVTYEAQSEYEHFEYHSTYLDPLTAHKWFRFHPSFRCIESNVVVCDKEKIGEMQASKRMMVHGQNSPPHRPSLCSSLHSCHILLPLFLSVLKKNHRSDPVDSFFPHRSCMTCWLLPVPASHI